MMQQTDSAQILQIAVDLLFGSPRRRIRQEEVDGRFYFEVWEQSWLKWVSDTRLALFGITNAPYPKNSPEPRRRLTAKERKILVQLILPKMAEMGFVEDELINHTVAATALKFPRLLAVTEPAQIPIMNARQPRVAVFVYSESVTGNEVKARYQSLQSTRRLVQETPSKADSFTTRASRRPRFQSEQHPRDLIRTWAILCLNKRAGLTARNAILRWNESFPENRYRNPPNPSRAVETGLIGDSVTTAGESQFSRDKNRLMERLNLTS